MLKGQVEKKKDHQKIIFFANCYPEINVTNVDWYLYIKMMQEEVLIWKKPKMCQKTYFPKVISITISGS